MPASRVVPSTLIDDPMREHLGYGKLSFDRGALARLFQADVTTLIPRGIRASRTYREGQIRQFVYEEPPTRRGIHYSHKAEERSWSHEVWTPWLYYVVYVADDLTMVSHLFFRKEQLRNGADMLYYPSLPNVYAGTGDEGFGKVCFGAAQVPTVHSEDGSIIALDQTISAAIAAWWGAPFNKDILAFRDYDPFVTMSRMSGPIDNTVDEIAVLERGFAVWERLTLEQFNTLPFVPVYTFGELLARMDAVGGGVQTPGQQLVTRMQNALSAANAIQSDKGGAMHYDLFERRWAAARAEREMNPRKGESNSAFRARIAAYEREDALLRMRRKM